MGILDDLAMGFGLKERTADYDARTARTIAANKASEDVRSRGGGDHAAMVAGIRARQNYDPSSPTDAGAYFLDRAGARGGYEAGGYRPTIAQDERPFLQRALFSPESTPSPSPYAIGPLQMDQPLPSFGVMGLIKALAGGGNKKPLQSSAISALEGGTLKAPSQVAKGILPADDGQITEEELAEMTGEAAASNEFEGMNATEIKDALLAKFRETGEDPTLEYDAAELFNGDDVFINYLKTKPMEDRAVAYANRLAGK